MRRSPFVKVGRPATTGVGVGARARKPSMGKGMSPQMGMGPGAGLGAAPGGGASPMQGLQQAVPAAAFKRGGRVPHYHDDARLRRGNSEHGFASSDDHFGGMCNGGKV